MALILSTRTGIRLTDHVNRLYALAAGMRTEEIKLTTAREILSHADHIERILNGVVVRAYQVTDKKRVKAKKSKTPAR
jgi:hypothetical protein